MRADEPAVGLLTWMGILAVVIEPAPVSFLDRPKAATEPEPEEIPDRPAVGKYQRKSA